MSCQGPHLIGTLVLSGPLSCWDPCLMAAELVPMLCQMLILWLAQDENAEEYIEAEFVASLREAIETDGGVPKKVA